MASMVAKVLMYSHACAGKIAVKASSNRTSVRRNQSGCCTINAGQNNAI
ncbi:hypothetical protein BH10BAC2_BH10BAC2_34070 [soil metagenome]